MSAGERCRCVDKGNQNPAWLTSGKSGGVVRDAAAPRFDGTTMGSTTAHHLSGLLCGLSVLPLGPPRPVSAALIVGVVVVLTCTVLFDPVGRDCLFRKLALYGRGAAQMVVGKDKKWKKSGRPDPARVAAAGDRRSKRVVFIRHGESEWNLIFNVGSKIFVPFKAVAALVRETALFLRLDDGSVLYDSPLNDEGLKQARDLDDVFQSFAPDAPGAADVARVLDRDASVVATSNLRRAAQTVALGLRTRLERNADEKMHCLSALQEISTNIDTHISRIAHHTIVSCSGHPLLAKDQRFWPSESQPQLFSAPHSHLAAAARRATVACSALISFA